MILAKNRRNHGLLLLYLMLKLAVGCRIFCILNRNKGKSVLIFALVEKVVHYNYYYDW